MTWYVGHRRKAHWCSECQEFITATVSGWSTHKRTHRPWTSVAKRIAARRSPG